MSSSHRFPLKPTGENKHTPYTQYPLLLGHHVDPLLKQEVFKVSPKTPEKTRVFAVGGMLKQMEENQ